MSESYLTELRALIEKVTDRHDAATHIMCKHFFSGAAAYHDGQIFMSWTPVGIALKLAEADRNAVFAQGGKPLRYFPQAPIKKDYVVFPDHVCRDHVALGAWIARSLKHVGRKP